MAFLVSPVMFLGLGGSAVALASWIGFWIRQHGVKRDMREYAEANSFEWLGKKLPDSFVFRGTGLSDPEVVDVVKGTLHGVDMVIFTASMMSKIGNSVQVRSQTVVAFPNVHQIGSRQIPPTGDPNFYFEIAGDWFVLYYRAAVVGKDKMAAWCEKMYAVTQKIVSDVRAKGQ
jgi:hypothetical protein